MNKIHISKNTSLVISYITEIDLNQFCFFL